MWRQEITRSSSSQPRGLEPPTPAFPGVTMPQPNILHRSILKPPYYSPLKFEEFLPFSSLYVPHTTQRQGVEIQTFQENLIRLPLELRRQIYSLLINPWSRTYDGPVHTPMRGPVAFARLLKTPDRLKDISYQCNTSFYPQRLAEFEWKDGWFDYFQRDDLTRLGSVEDFLRRGDREVFEELVVSFWEGVVLDLKGERGGWYLSDWKSSEASLTWLQTHPHLFKYIQNISLDLVSSTLSNSRLLQDFTNLCVFISKNLTLETVYLWIAVSQKEGEKLLRSEFPELVQAIKQINRKSPL